MELIWRKHNHTRDIEITIDDNIPDIILRELMCRLVGGDYAAILQPPRGRRVIYFLEDALILEMPPNPEVTNWAGRKIHGDAVIVSPDIHKRIKRA